jgi:hypothetical protein
MKINNTVIDWKGTYFQQISASIKYNKKLNVSEVGAGDMFRARPLRIYRKEIASSAVEHCNPRISMSIDDFNRPGGTITTSALTNNGLANIEAIPYSNNSCDHPSTNELCSVFLSAENNARRRVRSSGMMRPKFNASLNNDTYYTTSGQYMSRRNKSFEQNQYFHIRVGDNTNKPGSSSTIQNVYSANGLSDCICTIPDTTFEYRWIDNTLNTVNLSAGSYTLDQLNTALFTVMEAKKHYYLENTFNTIIHLLRFEYNVETRRIIIASTATNKTIHPTLNFSTPLADPALIAWVASIPDAPLTKNPSIVVATATFSSMIGFSVGTYPSTLDNTPSGNLSVSGTSPSRLQPRYVPIYYKPSNPQFAVQGAVSSGDLINRKKYDTITSVGASFRNAYGNQTANALAYGSSMYGYTIKDKIGYPNKKTPTFPKSSNTMVVCELTKISNAI